MLSGFCSQIKNPNRESCFLRTRPIENRLAYDTPHAFNFYNHFIDHQNRDNIKQIVNMFLTKLCLVTVCTSICSGLIVHAKQFLFLSQESVAITFGSPVHCHWTEISTRPIWERMCWWHWFNIYSTLVCYLGRPTSAPPLWPSLMFHMKHQNVHKTRVVELQLYYITFTELL